MPSNTVTLLFREAAIHKFQMKPGSDDEGYRLTASLSMSSLFTPELARQLRCHENFFDSSDKWIGGVSAASLPAVVDDVQLELYELAALKKDAPVLSVPSCQLSGFSVYDEDGTPRISWTAKMEAGISKIASFLDKRKYYRGDLKVTVNQLQLSFGSGEEEEEPAAEEDGVLWETGVDADSPVIDEGDGIVPGEQEPPASKPKKGKRGGGKRA